MADLKPCPFCGSEELNIWSNYEKSINFVYCEGCGAAGRSESTEEKAVESWNRRYEDAICFCRDCRWFEDNPKTRGDCKLHKIKVRKNDYCFGAWRK